MRDLSNMKVSFIEYLREHHAGAKNVISSAELERAFEVKGVELRKIVNELRCSGEPVCSNTRGYFFAQNRTEIKNSVKQLKSRVKKIMNAADGLDTLCGRFRHNPKKKEGG